jgi:hypothetical protein
MTATTKQAPPAFEWTPEDQALVPLDHRRFGPCFEKPCRNPDAMICARPSCQAVYSFRWRVWDLFPQIPK